MSRRQTALMIDPDKCIACRACQVACKQWNELDAQETVNRGSFENPADVSSDLYNRIRFIEDESGERLGWHFFSQRCLHCSDAGCVKVCPSGALFHNALGFVEFDRARCISCKYCISACPFEIPRYDAEGRIAKCHMCTSRIANGLQPACSKVCPTGSIRYHLRSRVIADAKAGGKTVYGEEALGGLGAMYALGGPPSRYGLPDTPQIPPTVLFWKDFVRPMGWVAFWGALAAALVHYVTVGPKNIARDDEEGGS